MSASGWYGVDLDGTLAFYDGWKGADHIGEPVPAMLFRVRKWLAEGKDVRIFTARVSYPTLPAGHPNNHELFRQWLKRRDEAMTARRAIRRWCEQHFDQRLPVTNEKDYAMVELWDDRAVQVEPNTGRRIDGKDDVRRIMREEIESDAFHAGTVQATSQPQADARASRGSSEDGERDDCPRRR